MDSIYTHIHIKLRITIILKLALVSLTNITSPKGYYEQVSNTSVPLVEVLFYVTGGYSILLFVLPATSRRVEKRTKISQCSIFMKKKKMTSND